MSQNTPNVSPIMTDFYGLRHACVKRMYQEPRARWSREERDRITQLMAEFAQAEARARKYVNADWRENPGLMILHRDLAEFDPMGDLEIPKWACLASWLTPESVATHAPGLVETIAKLALADQLSR